MSSPQDPPAPSDNLPSPTVVEELRSHLMFYHDQIAKILELSKTPDCTIIFGSEKGYSHNLYRSRNNTVELDTSDDGNTLFPIPGVMKIFIALGLTIMLEILPSKGDPRYSKLDNARNRPFDEVFNDHSEKKITLSRQETKPSSKTFRPTVLEVLVSFRLPDINRILFAPDGSILLFPETFLDIIPQYFKDAPESSYSNLSAILIGLFIEVVSGESLSDFLREHIFAPYGMDRTFTSPTELRDEKKVNLHSISADGSCTTIEEKYSYMENTVALASVGGWSCARDLGIFFNTLLSEVRNKSTPFHGLIAGLNSCNSKTREGIRGTGMYIRLDGKYLGHWSLNQKISPSGTLSKRMLEVEEIEEWKKNLFVDYQASSITGSSGTAYICITFNIFLIVLTNATGPLDLSDILGRLWVETFMVDTEVDTKVDTEVDTEVDTKVDTEVDTKVNHVLPDWVRRFWVDTEVKQALPDKAKNDDYCQLASKVWEENSAVVAEFEQLDKLLPDAQEREYSGICGTYVNEYNQRLEVSNEHGWLRVQLGVSTLMRLAQCKEEDTLRICSLPPMIPSIDCFTSWKTLEFKVERQDGIIFALTTIDSVPGGHFKRENND